MVYAAQFVVALDEGVDMWIEVDAHGVALQRRYQLHAASLA
jgi:hypothetical protein